MSEHTWQVDKEPEWAEESGGYWAVYIDESKLIAKVYGEANARLIAAAPELLRAAELVLDAWAAQFAEHPTDLTTKALRAAIAKARGEQS